MCWTVLIFFLLFSFSRLLLLPISKCFLRAIFTFHVQCQLMESPFLQWNSKANVHFRMSNFDERTQRHVFDWWLTTHYSLHWVSCTLYQHICIHLWAQVMRMHFSNWTNWFSSRWENWAYIKVWASFSTEAFFFRLRLFR